MRKEQAFTFIELLISLIILAILASIAYPSYQKYIIQSRRGDAQTELVKAQIEQSNYHITHPTYIEEISSAGLPTNNPYYTFSIISASVSSYLMKAEARENTSQSNDKENCSVLFINQNGQKTSDGVKENTQCWSH